MLFSCYTLCLYIHFFFFFNDTATTEIYTLSLHDALPISFVLCVSAKKVCTEGSGKRTGKETAATLDSTKVNAVVQSLAEEMKRKGQASTECSAYEGLMLAESSDRK